VLAERAPDLADAMQDARKAAREAGIAIVGGHTIAVLLMTNFGSREECIVNGVPVGRLLGPVVSTGSTSGAERLETKAPAGSCIGISSPKTFF